MKELKKVPGGRALPAILALLASVTPGVAQYEEPPPPAAFALENVTVLHPDGRRESGVNLVVRGGLIAAMGPGVAVTPDATVLGGDSLMVSPGLLDAHGTAPMAFPEEESREAVLPWAPARDAQGFTPHRLTAGYLTGAGADGREARRAGVIAAGVHPEGGMAPGLSATVLFRKDARNARETVVRPRLGLSFSFQGARGVYPGSLFAVMAHFRQMFEDAAHEGLVRSEYAADPTGLLLPTWDPDLEVLRQAASGQLPVFFAASSAGDIRRVLDLADEIGFRPVILGGEEAWKVRDALLTRGVPVLVSVTFPTPTEWNPEDEASGGEGTPSTQVSLEPAAAREKERLENAYRNAARLVEAGLTVALTSGGRGGDYRDGVAKTIEYGLSEDDALRGVTTIPASILGIPHHTTLARGMAANLVVTDGPLFGDGTRVLYTFVEGQLERGREGRGEAGGEAPTVDVTGSWEVIVSAQGMEMPFIMSLAQDGAEFSGTMASPDMGEAQVTGGSVSGNRLQFTLVFSMGPESMEVSVRATVEGETMNGNGSGEMGSFSFNASRAPGWKGGIR
jgi:imidazolonepropionase-like amidohydrolase